MTVGSMRTPLALLVELLWMFAAVALFVQLWGQDDGPAPSIVTIVAVGLGAFAFARYLRSYDLDEGSMRRLGVAVSLAALFVIGVFTYADAPWDFGWVSGLLAEPSETIEPNGHVVAGMVALLGAWARGVQRGMRPQIDFDDVLASVSVGFAIVVIAALSDPPVIGDVSWGALAFAFGAMALLTLAVFNAPVAQPLAAFAGRWSMAIAGLAGVAIAGALIAGTADADAFDVLSPLLEPLRVAGRTLGTYVFEPLAWLIALPFRALFAFLDLFATDEQNPQELPPPMGEEREPSDEEEPLWFRVLLWAGTGAGIVAAGALVLIVLWWAFRRFMRRDDADPRERREAVAADAGSGGGLGSMFGALGRRFRRTPGTTSGVAIRQLYFEVLAAAEERGIGRAPSATPLQFAPQLDAYFSSDAPSQISAAFVESRYGERAVDADRVGSLRERWRQALAGRADV